MVSRAAKKVKTSIVMDQRLMRRLKHAAIDEQTDVSTLLARLATNYLKSRTGKRS